MNPNYDLHLAIDVNNINKARKAFKNGADTTNINLDIPIKNNNLDMTKLLLEKGANNNNEKFLHIAIKNNNFQMIKLLLKYLTPFKNKMLYEVNNFEMLQFLYNYMKEPVQINVVKYHSYYSWNVMEYLYEKYIITELSDITIFEPLYYLLKKLHKDIKSTEFIIKKIKYLKEFDIFYSDILYPFLINDNFNMMKLTLKDNLTLYDYHNESLLGIIYNTKIINKSQYYYLINHKINTKNKYNIEVLIFIEINKLLLPFTIKKHILKFLNYNYNLQI